MFLNLSGCLITTGPEGTASHKKNILIKIEVFLIFVPLNQCFCFVLLTLACVNFIPAGTSFKSYKKLLPA